jgi:hypothetical protein
MQTCKNQYSKNTGEDYCRGEKLISRLLFSMSNCLKTLDRAPYGGRIAAYSELMDVHHHERLNYLALWL